MKPHFQKCFIKCLLLYIATLSVNAICAQTRPPVLTTGVAYGQAFFSKIITIQTVLSNDILEISPVPARRYTMIKWSSANNSKLNITLFNVAGRFVLCRQYPLKKGENELLLTNLEALPAGIYFIKASDGATYRNGKLRIQP